MSLALAPTLTPLQIHEDLHAFLAYLEEQFSAANQYSADTLQNLKDRYVEISAEWQEIAQRARGLLGSLPREIVHRNLSEDLRLALDHCEQNVRHWFGNLASFAALEEPAKLKAAWDELVLNLQKLRTSAKELSSNLGSLQAHPLFQKFLQGQRVLASRNQLQWGRKAFHTLTGLFGLWLYGYSGLNESAVIWILAACFTGASMTEILRRVFPQLNRRICERFRGIMRERERHKISSATYFMGAILAVFLIFPMDVGLLAVYFTSVGDTAAGIVGSRWGKHKWGTHVSLEGSLACFAICFFGCLWLAGQGLMQYRPQGWELFLFSFLAASVATLAESTLKRFDDNLTIPLLSAPAVWLLMRLL